MARWAEGRNGVRRGPGDWARRAAVVLAAGPLVLAGFMAGPARASAGFGVTATITVLSGASAVAVNPATNTLYVANDNNNNSSQDTVWAINGATNQITGSIPIGSRTRPDAIAVNPATDTIYVAGNKGVTVINGATNQVTATIPVRGNPLVGLVKVGVDPVTDTVYVSNSNLGNVLVINGATNQVTATIFVGCLPDEVEVDPVTDTVYVSNLRMTTMAVINGATNQVTATIHTGGRWGSSGLAVNPDTNTVYATAITQAVTETGNVAVINGAANQVTATIPANVTALGADPATNTVYAVQTSNFTYGNFSVLVINGATNQVTATIPISKRFFNSFSPSDMAVNSATGNAYVLTPGIVSVIGRPAASTQTALKSSPTPVTAGHPATYTATVTPEPDGGTVSFSDGGQPIPACQDVRLSGTTATCTQTYNSAGTHTITAAYSGAPAFTGSASPTVTETSAPHHAQPWPSAAAFGTGPAITGTTGATLAGGVHDTTTAGTIPTGTTTVVANLTRGPWCRGMDRGMTSPRNPEISAPEEAAGDICPARKPGPTEQGYF